MSRRPAKAPSRMLLVTWRGVLAALTILLVAVPAPAAAETIREMQWFLDTLRIDAAHRHSTGAGVLVGLVDTGVDAGHPDLRGVVTRSLSVVGGGDAKDPVGHGTVMAGLIAAQGGGANQARGIAPAARIISVQDSLNVEGRDARTASAIRVAVDQGVEVINLSLVESSPSQEMRAAIAYAQAKDVVVVAGAGNTSQGMREIGSPANLPGVIAVTGLSRLGSFWTGSTQGKPAVIAAPAQDVVSTKSRTVSQTGYGRGNGTSSATAIVTGAVALVRSRFPDLDAANVINRLIATADDRGPAGRDPQYGFGALDIVGALTADVPTVSTNPLGSLTEANPSGSTTTGDDVYAEPDWGPLEPLRHSETAVPILGLGSLCCLLVVALIIWAITRATRSGRSRVQPEISRYPAPPPPQWPPPSSSTTPNHYE